MDTVVRFEKRRTRWWIVIFVGALLFFGAGIVWAFFRSYTTLSDQHTFDIFELLWEDREVIAEFWQETLDTVLTEIPKWMITLGVGFTGLFVGIWVGTRHRRSVVMRRMVELAKHKEK